MQSIRGLNQLSMFDLIAEVPGHFLSLKRTMIDISYALEETAAAATAPCQLFVGFQRFSLFAPHVTRYAQLAQSWSHCWIFGVPNAELPTLPNVTAVPINPDSPLAQEWFVIVDGPGFGSALLTAETSAGMIDDRRRRFTGLWSADPALVRSATTQLSEALGVPAPTWSIDSGSTLRNYDLMCNRLVAIQEERLLTLQAR